MVEPTLFRDMVSGGIRALEAGTHGSKLALTSLFCDGCLCSDEIRSETGVLAVSALVGFIAKVPLTAATNMR